MPVPDPEMLRASIEKVLREVLEPMGRLEWLKSKPYLTGKEVQELYGVPAKSLSTWRNRGGGPEYVQSYKYGQVLYSHASIQNFHNRCQTRG